MLAPAYDRAAPAVDRAAPAFDWDTRRAPGRATTRAAAAGALPTAGVEWPGPRLRGARPSSVPAKPAGIAPEEVAGATDVAHQPPRCGVSGEGPGLDAVQEVAGAAAVPPGVATSHAEPGKTEDGTDTACGCGGNKGCSCTTSPAPPHAGDATIVCDGAGGYRVDLGSWAGAPCGTEGCVRTHENQHIADWKGRWPDGCKGKPDGGQIPLGGPGYAAFLKASECRAHTVDLICANVLLQTATGDCKAKVQKYVDLTEQQRKHWC